MTKQKREFHGLRNTPEYAIWNSMKQRCYNPKHVSYKRYGALGIDICKEWKESFNTFYRDMGPRPSSQYSIERIDNTLGYMPKNCRWATAKEQANNTRNNYIISAFGKAQTVAMWEMETGIPSYVIRARIHRHKWPPEKAVSSPVGKQIEYKGKKDTLSNWCKLLRLDYFKVQQRIKKLGWSATDAFEKP